MKHEYKVIAKLIKDTGEVLCIESIETADANSPIEAEDFIFERMQIEMKREGYSINREDIMFFNSNLDINQLL